MESTRRNLLVTGGLVGGALGLGVTGRLIALGDVDNRDEPPEERVDEATLRQRVQMLIERLGDEPVDMLNLLKFVPGGEASYRRYGREFTTLVAKYAPGTEVPYMADFAGMLAGDIEWDRLIVVRYPSIKAFVALTSSQDYRQIAHHRSQAIERGMLYAMLPIDPYWEE
jgi:uncharacterized protein (DUF1330 family)